MKYLFLILALTACQVSPSTPSTVTVAPTESEPVPSATFTVTEAPPSVTPTDTPTAIITATAPPGTPTLASTPTLLPTLPSPTPFAGSPPPPTAGGGAAFPTPIAKTYFRLTLVNNSGQPVIFKLESLFQPGRGYLIRLSPGHKITVLIAGGNYQSTIQACGIVRSSPADISDNARLVFGPCP